MSYTRWSNSNWYSYWMDREGEPSLMIHHVQGEPVIFEAGDLQDSLACLSVLRERVPTATPADLVEADYIIGLFIEDVAAGSPVNG